MKHRYETLAEAACPAHQYTALTEITPAELARIGARAVVIDLDNTAVLDSSYHVPESTKVWLAEMRAAEIPVAIVSNTYFHRGWYLAKKMGNLPFIALANKPNARPLRRMARKLRLPVSQLAMVGDQLFADVLAANRAGAIAVRVEPMAKERRLVWYFKRLREKEQAYLQACRAAESPERGGGCAL